MEIIRCDTMPDGTKIQLEDWTGKNTPEYPNLYGYIIAAYPIARRSSRYKWIEVGTPFLLDIPHNHYDGYEGDAIISDYNSLVSGEKSLADLRTHFWNGEKDAYYLGLDTDYQEK